MLFKLRVQSQHFQGPDAIQVQFAAVEGQANLNATVSKGDAAEYPVGAVVTVEVTQADEDEG